MNNPFNSDFETYTMGMSESSKNYDVIKSGILLRKQMANCEINGIVDLIVRESDNEISIVKVIDSDEKISGFIDEYMYYLYFYTSILKTLEEFKGCKFKNIILHSTDNNKVHIRPYQRNIEASVLDDLKDMLPILLKRNFTKKCIDVLM